MHRRRFLKRGGIAGLALALGGCSYRSTGLQTRWVRPARLVPVHVSWDRIIRTTVGLRPYRESGFVVRSERLDDKTVIHNYGHGGSGLSLSWGTSHLAVNIAVAHAERRAAVIGCGIVGLTSARMLQRRGFQVSVYAKELPPDTTSNNAWGGFTPVSSLVGRRTAHWDGQFRRAVEIAYREHQLLVGRGYGVRWIDGYSRTDRPDIPSSGSEGGASENADGVFGDRAEWTLSETEGARLLPRSYEPGGVLLHPGEHPFPSLYARRTPMLQFDPDVYLDALMRDVVAFGGKISTREFESPRELYALPEPLIVNCTGLGAKRIFGDEELTPVKGQLTVLVPQAGVDYSVGAMIPRDSGIVLGHVRQHGVSSLQVDEREQRRVVESAVRIFSSMRPPDPTRWPDPLRSIEDSPRERAGRDESGSTLGTSGTPHEVPPVESFFGARS